MKRKGCFGSVVILCCISMAASLCWAGNGWENISKEIVNAKSVIIDPANPNIIYLGTERGIFKSLDAGASWRNIFLTRGRGAGVNLLVFDPVNSDNIYAATANGLFYSPDKGVRWNKVFKGKNSFEADCLALVVLADAIYLGTKQGLFVSLDKGRSWHKGQGKLKETQVFNILNSIKDPKELYLSSVDGVFKSIDSGKSWTRVFIAYPTEDGTEDDNGDEDTDDEIKYSQVRYIAIDPDNPRVLYLATMQGIYQSNDSGLTWKAFTESGLLSRDVHLILSSKGSGLYCATKSGVFVSRGSTWEEVSLALSFKKINFIALDKDGYLYACLDTGLFKFNPLNKNNTGGSDILKVYYEDEPTIKEVQEAAIYYAEVNPEKISRWRKQAARRAWLPKITMGADFDKDKTVSKSIWGTSGTSTYDGKHYVGPDDETRYDNMNLGVSLTWDFGDLIWNSSQTSIDVRSRLMVQLRDDILDEVNKLYFERIRVKMEVDGLAIQDRKKRFEKELRLRELTASIDALTGGFFSKQL